MTNHYHTLGVPEDATAEAIKMAFKQLAVLYHPDKHSGDPVMEERFKEINQAYQVLSDPYKRAQFDHQLQYVRFVAARQQEAQPRYSDIPRYRPRPQYGRPISREENNRATLYAFAITFGIALLFFLVRGANDLYQQRKVAQEMAARQQRFLDAKQAFENDQFVQSLTILADLAPFRPEEDHIRRYQSDVIEDVIFKGEAHYLQRDFANAIKYYELVERFSPYRPTAMRARLAQSYRFEHRPHESLQIFKGLIEEDYQTLPTLVQMAEVYSQELKDYEEAKNYLELARELAVDEYNRRFGKAYMVFITNKWIPVDHYYLYRNLGHVYNQLDQPEKSLGTSGWLQQIWPDSVDGYVMAAKSFEIKGEQAKACAQYQKARRLGHADTLPLFCR